jgi:L,D-peptidoglycan transpeptidase YkuD (ErfK/YbiS/YcfS/YnhG family)
MRTAAVLAFLLLVASAPMDPSPISGAQQLIVVVAPDWSSTSAVMTRYDLRNGKWEAAAAPTAVILGRTGLAWGHRGLSEIDSRNGPMKREGDGKSPAGAFRLGTAFGFAAAPSSLRLPYRQLRDTTECVDDSSSSHYNTIVDRNAVTRVDWSSSEKMRSIAVYEHGVVVVQNDPPRPTGGSCIFLHLVDPKGRPTAGCTSMSPEAMDALLQWVDPARAPLLVQLPQAEYDRLRPLWRLP